MPTNLGFAAKAQRLAGSLEQGGVHHALMASGQRAQLGRQREGDQKVGARQQAVGLLLEPGLGLLVLAGRAMPVAARSADRVDLPAGLADVEHGPEFACAARGDRVQHLLVLPGHGGAEPLEILPAVPPQDVGDGRHGLWFHQLVDHGDRLLLADGGEMEVNHRRLQRAVAQVLLDQPQVDPGLQKMGGVAVPQRVD